MALKKSAKLIKSHKQNNTKQKTKQTGIRGVTEKDFKNRKLQKNKKRKK